MYYFDMLSSNDDSDNNYSNMSNYSAVLYDSDGNSGSEEDA